MMMLWKKRYVSAGLTVLSSAWMMETYMQKFTPRKDISTWSELDKKRTRKMFRQRRMTEAGLAKIREAKKNGTWAKTVTSKRTFELTPELKKKLAANKKAWGISIKCPPPIKSNIPAGSCARNGMKHVNGDSRKLSKCYRKTRSWG